MRPRNAFPALVSAWRNFPQSVPNLTEASQNLYELIKGRNLLAYPDAGIRLAISRAVAVETPRGWRIGKDKQSHKIDVVVALAMAALAAVQTQSSYDSSMAWVGGPGLSVDEPLFTSRRQYPWGVLN
jgi:phage terminase large subunit-like protein